MHATKLARVIAMVSKVLVCRLCGGNAADKSMTVARYSSTILLSLGMEEMTTAVTPLLLRALT